MRIVEQSHETEMAARHVRISGEIFLYREKQPFVASGFSVRGGIEYDKSADLVRCHECGEWRCHLAAHAFNAHGLTAREYKMRHGLNQKTALCNEGIRGKLIKHGNTPFMLDNMKKVIAAQTDLAGARALTRPKGPRAELRNLNGLCQAQILTRIRELADNLGRTPLNKELHAIGINVPSVEHLFGYRMREVITLAGLIPRRGSLNAGRKRYTPAFLIERLRDHWVRFGRTPSQSDHKRCFLPHPVTYIRCFGSMAAAHQAAGLGLAVVV